MLDKLSCTQVIAKFILDTTSGQNGCNRVHICAFDQKNPKNGRATRLLGVGTGAYGT